MDPALVDRTKQSILGIAEGEQPIRPMTIPGIAQSIPAKILSTNLRAASTRVVRIDPGWGSLMAGAFTADVEVFVLEGDIRIGTNELTDYEYAAIPQAGVVDGFGSNNGAIALLITSGPLAYDTSTQGRMANVVLGRPTITTWRRESKLADVFMRPLASSMISEVWLGSTMPGGDALQWHMHSHDEETFVLEGEFSCRDLSKGEVVITHASPGSYLYRPAGARHSIPFPMGEEPVITFHRSLGTHETRLIEKEDLAVG